MKTKTQAHAAEALARKTLGGAVLLGLSACAQAPQGVLPAPLLAPPARVPEAPAGIVASPGSAQSSASLVVGEAPAIPEAARRSSIKGGPPAAPVGEKADITLMFDQLPLPSFVQVVFGTILKKNFSMDPVVAAKTDLVVLRSGAPQTPTEVLETAKMLLKQYGVAVTEMGGFYRIAPDSNLSAYMPEIRRGRAQPDVPLPLRPVFNLVEMSAVKNTEVSGWLKAMFGTKVSIQEDPTRNALLLGGQTSDITAALEAIQVLDQPLMRGRSSRLLTPASLSSEEMARRLAEVLTAEGYSVSGAGTGVSAISLLPIAASNAVLVFAIDPVVVAHIVDWAKKLDALDISNRRNGNYFTYEVKYADAQTLAKTLQELLTANAAAEAAALAAQAAAVPAGSRVIGAAPTPKSQGRIVVNKATNTLIFSCTADEFSQLQSIMKELDQPAKSALIEVTVAEVRVTDKNQLGVEWGFNRGVGGGSNLAGGTLGGLGNGTDGLTVNFLNGAQKLRASLNALASNNRATILSSPRIMARNGEIASIQVGQEVPTITSQQSGTTGVVGTSNAILQTIQYRNTGVILKVKPIIFAGGRIELEVTQEVSSAAETKTGVTSSPTISSRKIETKLSIRDGSTVLLGGLMSRSDSKGDTGVPLLKDIPVAGQLFRTNTDTNDKTELIVLITPYVITDDLVAEQLTDAFRTQLGSWTQWDPASPAPRAVNRAPDAARPESGAVINQPAAGEGQPVPAKDSAPSQSVSTATNVEVASPSAPAVAPDPALNAGGGVAPDFGKLGKPVTDPNLEEELRRAKATPLLAPVPVPNEGNGSKVPATTGKSTAKPKAEHVKAKAKAE